MKKILLFIAAVTPLFAQDIFTTVTPATGANVATGDMIQIRDVSVTSGAGKIKPMTLGDLVNVPGLFSSVANGTFNLSKLAQSGATSGQVVKWNGTAWAPAADASEPVTNGAVVSALGFTPVNPSSVSNVGGANKVIALNSDGDLVTSNVVNNDNIPLNPGGNILIPDKRGIQWYRRNGTRSGAQIWHWEDHGGGEELIIGGETRIALLPIGPLQVGRFDAGRSGMFVDLSTSDASAGDTMRASKAVGFRVNTWNGSANVLDHLAVQCWPLDTSGTNSEWVFYNNVSRFVGADLSSNPGIQGDVQGLRISRMSKEGTWNPGIAPTAATLVDNGTTVTQTCSIYKTVQFAKATLTGNRTLVINGAVAGMRGVIYIAQDATGNRLLPLPTGSSTQTGYSLSITPETADRLSWEFDGTLYYFSIHKGFSTLYNPADSDALAFINAVTTAKGSAVTSVQRAAIDNFVIAEKAASRWTLHKRIYLPIWGNAAANVICMKTLTTATFPNGATHGSGFVQGNGTTQYMAMGVTAPSLGMTSSDMHMTALLLTLPSAAFQGFIGASSGGANDSFVGNGSNGPLFTHGTFPSVDTGAGVRRGILTATRDATKWEVYQRTTATYALVGTRTAAAEGISSQNLVAMSITPNDWRNTIQFGAFVVGQSFSTQSAFTSNLKTLWETCTGLALP